MEATNKPRASRRKPTAREHAERVEFVVSLLSKLFSRTQIHRAVETKWGVHWRTSDRYMVRAKEELRRRCNMPKDEARELGLTVILDCLKSTNAGVRIRAEQRLAEITGYNAPTRTELSGPNGAPIQTAERFTVVELPALEGDHLTERRVVAQGGNGDVSAGGVGGNGDRE